MISLEEVIRQKGVRDILKSGKKEGGCHFKLIDYEKYVFSGKTLQKISMNDLGVPVAH